MLGGLNGEGGDPGVSETVRCDPTADRFVGATDSVSVGRNGDGRMGPAWEVAGWDRRRTVIADGDRSDREATGSGETGGEPASRTHMLLQ